MLQTFVNAFRSPDIRRKILFTFMILLIYRLGCFVPIPGIKVNDSLLGGFRDVDFLNMFSAITGGSFENGTLFALGIVPFINAFIIMQLLTLIVPKLEKLSKEGEEGRKQITKYTRYLAILLAIVQAIGVMFAWRGAIRPVFGPSMASEVFTMIFVILILTGGSSLVMWLGERITEFGIGNGTSLIIFTGIVGSLGASVFRGFANVIPDQWRLGTYTGPWVMLGFILLVVILFFIITFIDMSERKIGVQYAKQIKGNKMYGGQSTHIPIKVNASGVMPIIFASSLIMFPQMIIQFAGLQATNFAVVWGTWLGSNGHLYSVIMFLLIIFFAFFYAQIQFNPDDISRMLQQNGGFIPGIRPGRPTAEHLKKINNRLTLFGAFFLGFIALIPTLLLQQIPAFQPFGFGNAFSATGLLIVVSVALEFQKQLESQLLVKHNKGFLK
ncbi:MAG: preprotein translocase subunit SecY [Firmicutes bacterium]|nr:preprotein translocase subunit SecY [Bacillota bacterium]